MKDSLPPLWVEKIEQAEEDISKIQNKSMSIYIIDIVLFTLYTYTYNVYCPDIDIINIPLI